MGETLSIAEFERLLSRGRGKVILYLQEHDAAPYREVIRRCCLTNTAYDPQCEGTRSKYLMDIIDLSDDSDTICEMAIQALHRETDYTHDFQRLFALVGRFAQRGFKMARQALYSWCRLHYDPNASSPGALYPLLYIDGVEAFIFLLDPRQSGRWFDMDGDDFDDFDSFLETLEEELGEEATFQALEAAIQDRPSLRETIARLYVRRDARKKAIEQRQQEPRSERQERSYAQLREELQQNPGRQGRFFLRKWGKQASDEDFYAAAMDFVTLDLSPANRINYATLFQERAFPLDDFSRLFEMARHSNLSIDRFPDDRSTSSSLLALEKISHPQVRAFALELFEQHMSMGFVAEILANNFEDGDWVLIESLFDHITLEPDYHDLGFSIQAILKNHPSSDAIPSLIRMYDTNPCSQCRERVVESLVSLNALPDWIAEECRYDSNLDLRDYAERGFKDDDDSDD